MRRLFWVGVGYCAGLGSVVWARRQAQRVPERMRQAVTEQSRRVGDGARRIGEGARRAAADLRDALDDGRAAMRATEDELREELDP